MPCRSCKGSTDEKCESHSYPASEREARTSFRYSHNSGEKRNGFTMIAAHGLESAVACPQFIAAVCEYEWQLTHHRCRRNHGRRTWRLNPWCEGSDPSQ